MNKSYLYHHHEFRSTLSLLWNHTGYSRLAFQASLLLCVYSSRPPFHYIRCCTWIKAKIVLPFLLTLTLILTSSQLVLWEISPKLAPLQIHEKNKFSWDKTLQTCGCRFFSTLAMLAGIMVVLVSSGCQIEELMMNRWITFWRHFLSTERTSSTGYTSDYIFPTDCRKRTWKAHTSEYRVIDLRSCSWTSNTRSLV